jgi:hypothetical protein
LGFKKELENNKGSFQLSISDIFSASDYRAHDGALITDAFDSNVYINYEAETYFRPIVKLSYSRSFGSNSKKNQNNTNGTKEEQERL